MEKRSHGVDRPRRRASVTPQRRQWWWAFAVFALLGTGWSLTVPLMEGPDESAHVVKAVAVTRGQLQTTIERRPSFLSSTVPLTPVRVPRAYQQLLTRNHCYQLDLTRPSSCAPPVGSDTRVVEASTYVGAYPPGYYAAIGWPSRLAPPRTAIYLMRLLSALLCAAFLASAFASILRMGVNPLAASVAALAVTPATLYLFGSINPNSLEIATAACAWASLLDLATRAGPPPMRLVIRAALACAVLGTLRALSPAFLVGIVVVAALVAGAERCRELRLDRRFRRAAVAVVVVATVSALYVVVARSYEVRDFPLPVDISRLDLAADQLRAAVGFQEQSIGLLSWFGREEVMVRPPRGLVVVWLVAALVSAAVASVVARWRERVALLLVVVATVGLPVVVALATGNGAWQGRYTIPISVGLPILSGLILGRQRVGRTASLAAVALAVFVAATWIVAWERRMTRNLVGLPNGPFAGLLDAPWDGPLAPGVLLVVVVTGALGLPVGVVARLRTGRTATDERSATTDQRPVSLG